MGNTEPLQLFFIEMSVYNTFVSLETSLYNELKHVEDKFEVDTKTLFEYYEDFYKLEEAMRAFNAIFENKPLDNFIKAVQVKNNPYQDCMVLDCTHRVNLISYTGAIQLMLMGIINNDPQRQPMFIAILIGIMNKYIYRGDPVPAYWQWNLQNSTYH